MIERADTSQYNTAFDSQRFVALMAQKETLGFESRLAKEKAVIRRHIRTDLGERLNVEKSEFVYEIRDGKLFDPGRDELMEDVVRNGNGRNPIDKERDEAEFSSFLEIQGILAASDTPDGTTILSISPKGRQGSFEKKNLFRVYVREGNYVIGSSFFSDLSNTDYRKKVLSINPAYSSLIPEKPDDVDLKSAPVVIPEHLDYSANPDKLASFMLDGRKVGIPREQLMQVEAGVTPLITSFINTLVENPQSLSEVEEGYQAILGGAYRSNEHIKGNSSHVYMETIFDSRTRAGLGFSGTPLEIKMLADDSKKMGGGACGSGSCSTETSASSFSGEFTFSGPDGKGTLSPHCPRCGAENDRPFGGYVEKCTACGSDEILPKAVKEKIKWSQGTSTSA